MSKSESRADRKMIGSVRRHRAQLAAQREAAVDVVGEADVDQREVGKPRAKRRQRLVAAGVGGDFVALLFQRVGVVGADRGLVLDDGDAAAHGERLYRSATKTPPPWLPAVILLPPLFARVPALPPGTAASARSNDATDPPVQRKRHHAARHADFANYQGGEFQDPRSGGLARSCAAGGRGARDRTSRSACCLPWRCSWSLASATASTAGCEPTRG